MKTNLTYNIKWHSIEAISYHTCLLTHHILFFLIAPQEIYGAIGTVLSCVYLATNILHLGIIDTIATFFTDFSRSQQLVKTFLLQQLSINLLAFFIFSIVCYAVYPYILPTIFTPNIIFLTLSITFFESFKKILKRFLRIAGMIPIIAGTSVISLLIFMITIWVPFAYGNNSLYITFVLSALVIMSSIECVVNTYYLYSWYKTLPTNYVKPLCKYRIYKNRWYMFLIDSGKLSISGNLLVPFFAATRGLHDAALLKFTSSLVHNIIAIIDKIINRTSIVIFSHTKYVNNTDKNNSLFTLSTIYNVGLCTLLIFFIWFRWNASLTIFVGGFILYYILQLLHKAYIPYTKMLVIQEKSLIVVVITIIQIFTTFGLMHATNNQIELLSSLIVTGFMQYILFLYITKICFNTKKPGCVPALAVLLLIFLLQGYWF